MCLLNCAGMASYNALAIPKIPCKCLRSLSQNYERPRRASSMVFRRICTKNQHAVSEEGSTLRFNLSNSITICSLFYTPTILIFNSLRRAVKIRDFFMLIMHRAPEEGSGWIYLQKGIERPNRHTRRRE